MAGAWGECLDEALLAGFGDGDPMAAAAFVRRFQARVLGLAHSIVGEQTAAEDIAQEAFARAFRHASSYDPCRGAVTTWMLVITRNLAVDALRARRTTPMDPAMVSELLGVDDRAITPHHAAVQASELDQVQSALRALPDVQRRALVLALLGGRTAKEISEGEGIPLGTAKTRLRLGLAKVRDALKQMDPAAT
jgi:RNA polymerase sigma factor (sigma-70 family)